MLLSNTRHNCLNNINKINKQTLKNNINKINKQTLKKISMRQMSFFRSNGNYSEGDKFAWEVGQEALGVKPVNDVGALKKTPYHFAMMNKTRTYGLSNTQSGGNGTGFGSKVQIHAQDWELEFKNLKNQMNEIRIPKEIYHSQNDAMSFSVGGYPYRASIHEAGKHRFIPQPLPPWRSQQFQKL